MKALREFRFDPVPIVTPEGQINPVFLHRGPCRPVTPREEVITDIVAEAMGRGIANIRARFLEEAVMEFDTAIALMPEFPHAHWNRGQALLMMGDTNGFAEFDWRFKMFGDVLWHKGIPIWSGESLQGKRLLCWHEHGYGDSIMLLRYVPVLQQMGAYITLALPEPLRRLAREQFKCEVLEEVPESWERFDYRCPIFNLLPQMHQMQIPVPACPYFTADPLGYGFKGEAKIIGIAWSGSKDHSHDKDRSIGIDKFMGMLDCNGHDPCAVQLASDKDIGDWDIVTIPYEDFAETADCLMAMDHIVTVDTAVAHLAGALGHPSLHVLCPYVAYWPWLNSATWYPTANVYHQTKWDDWAGVFARVNEAIHGHHPQDPH
jgi:hypothetical protein